jgi:hypothetical protein
MEIRGPASNNGKKCCEKKLCFVATDQSLLAEVLRQLAERPDCYYVKYSVYQKDGMYLGRCFLMDEQEVGLLWAKYKEHPRLFCSIQDDEFTAAFRPPDRPIRDSGTKAGADSIIDSHSLRGRSPIQATRSVLFS